MEVALPTFESILNDLPALEARLRQADVYLAHTERPLNDGPETLAKHMERVLLYFGKLTSRHGLDAVADRLALAAIPTVIAEDSRQRLAGEIKRLVTYAIWQHDFGKVNEVFQRERMKNLTRPDEPAVKHTFKHHHSLIGAYLFVLEGLHTLRKRETGKEFSIITAVLLALSYAIEKHHSPKLADQLLIHTSYQGDTEPLVGYLPRYHLVIPPAELAQIQFLMSKGYHTVAAQNDKFSQPDTFALYALVRLTFSLLTASDFYGTAHYYHGWDDAQPYDDFGLITGELREKIINNARTLQPYNRAVTEHLAERLADDPTQPAWQLPSADNLNRLRSRMAAEVVATVRVHAHERLFYLHAPTGGGKTNLSMLAAAELLDANPELTKIYYVFPFTTLITQTAQSLRDTLGLSGDEVMELHGRAAYKTNEVDVELDARYGRDHRTELDNLFINFPVCLLTHVRFVDILKTSRKEANYLLHRLANSVVILDELQSYDPRHWDKLAWLMKEYAHAFNIRFVLMSATLPRLGALRTGNGKEYVQTKFQELLPDAGRFIRNPNFSQRVRFDFSLEANLPTPEKGDADGRKVFLKQLAGAVLARSEEWATTHGGRVRTVIEFIFKKTATEFHELAEQLLPDYTLLVLSGTILEHRRRTIIHFLKNQPAGCPKVLLITTQVVEAGVDIDMDLGFKDRSLLDSEEQLAGRVNRNATKSGSVLYLFRLDSAKLLYGKDRRYGVQESRAFRDEAANILTNKNFDKLYGEVMDGIDGWNARVGGVNLGTYQDYYRRLNFPAADQELKLIEQETGTLFIPCEIELYPEVWAEGKFRPAARELFATDDEWAAFQQRHRLLTEGQLTFLAGQQVNLKNGRLAGQDVLALRKALIERPGKTRDDKQDNHKNKKQLQGILALFTCSLFAQSKDMQRIQHNIHVQEAYGIWALYGDAWDEIYTVDGGLRSDKLAINEFSVFL